MDIDFFRNPILIELVYKSEEARGHGRETVDTIINADKAWLENNHELEMMKKEKNKIQKQISNARKRKEKNIVDTQGLDTQGLDTLKNNIKEKEKSVATYLKIRNTNLNKIGNIIHPTVPVSDDEKENQLVYEWGIKLRNVPFHHSIVMEKLDAYNMKAGSVVAGHRGYFLKNVGVFLNQALIQYGIDFLMKKNYDVLSTPYFMREEMMDKTAQLSDYDELLYKVKDDKYLIATSEQPISCYHYNQWIEKKEFPIRYCGYSTCFRKEAGSGGKDLRGIFRVHQFEKVEQFCIVAPEDSWDEHERMRKISEEFLQSLGIPYRVVNIVSGELNDAAAKKYDIEGWFPHTQEYRELVSCSNCTDYQSRKLKIRYGHKEKGKKTKYVHMLNSTLCATERLMCCLVETCQNEKGIILPKVLEKYIPGGQLEYKYIL